MDCSLPDPPSIGFSRQEYWSELPFPSPGDVPNPGIELGSPAFQADALTSEPPRKPNRTAQITDCSPKQPLNDLNNLAVIPPESKNKHPGLCISQNMRMKNTLASLRLSGWAESSSLEGLTTGTRQRRLKESLLTPEQSWLASLAGMSRWWGQPSVTKTHSWNGWMQDSSQSRWLQVNVN